MEVYNASFATSMVTEPSNVKKSVMKVENAEV